MIYTLKKKKKACFSSCLPDPLIFRQAQSRVWGMSPTCRVQHATKQGEGSKDGAQSQPSPLRWAPAPLQARLERRSSVLPYPQLNPSLLNTRPSGRLFILQYPKTADRQCPVLPVQHFWVFFYCIGNILAAKSKQIISAFGHKWEKCLFL